MTCLWGLDGRERVAKPLSPSPPCNPGMCHPVRNFLENCRQRLNSHIYPKFAFSNLPMRENLLLEVCAFNVKSCLIAEKSGAYRVELCDNPVEGGTTPSYGAIKLAREKLT